MPNKDAIIDNVGQYTAVQLVGFINSGIVTFDELCNETDGSFSAPVRKEVKRILNDSNNEREKTSDNNTENPSKFVNINDFVALIKNIQIDKNTINAGDKLVETITKTINDGRISQENLLNILKENPNIVGSFVVDSLIKKGYLQYIDLERIGIPEVIIDHLKKIVQPQGFDPPKTPLQKIHRQSTEVYFWGIPASGKSCALGAILSVADSGKVAKCMNKDNDCQGYGYMTRLSALFSSNGFACTLPQGTDVGSTYEMGFDLEDSEGKMHPITCIDFAGELMRCMYKFDAKETMTEQETTCLDTLTNVLIDNRSTNRKIHFFVIEYGGEDRKYEGLSQKEYLEAALAYIQRTGIFKNDTDAIYLMITKVDKVHHVEPYQLNPILEKYLSDYYEGFYNGLEKICRDNYINNGQVIRIPFSLGTVCFQDYCLFNSAAASLVVKTLLKQTKGFKSSRFQKIKNEFKR